MADVERAKAAGRVEGMEFMTTVIVWLLLEKHGAPDEDLQQLSREVAYVADSITKGYLSYADMRRCMKEEYDWTVLFR